jgi:membrane fusion protein, multidrug efflux system
MKPFFYVMVLLPALAAAAEWTTRPLSEIATYAEFRATARVEALNESHIAAEVSGRIEALPARVGQAVAKGDALARIDASDYRIGVDRAAAQLALVASRVKLAEAQLAQSHALAARGFISADGLQIRETELAVFHSEHAAARQALAAARLPLARTVISAPFDGIVRERRASVGDLAAPGAVLVVLASTEDTEVHARVPTAQIDALQAAGEWQLSLGGRAHPLQLERVMPVVEAAGQTHAVVFSVAAPLAPGSAGELRWRAPTPQLPAEYVVQRDGQFGVWLERDGRAVFAELPMVQAGRAVALDWPLDTRVIDEGRFSLGLPRAAGQESPR